MIETPRDLHPCRAPRMLPLEEAFTAQRTFGLSPFSFESRNT